MNGHCYEQWPRPSAPVTFFTFVIKNLTSISSKAVFTLARLQWLERWRRSPCLWKQDSRATCTHLHGATGRNRTERETMLQTSRPAPEISCLQRSSLSRLLQGSQQCHQQTNERQVHPVLFPCACLAISFLLINSWKRNC